LDTAALVISLVFLEVVAEVVIAAVAGVPLDSLGDMDDPTQSAFGRAFLLPTLAVRAAGTIVIVAAILRCRGQSAESVGIGGQGLALNLLVGLAATVIAYGLIYVAMLIIWLIWPALWEQMQENAERIIDMVPRLHPLGFAGVALVISVYEELLFRGFLMTRLRRGTGSWTLAVVLSTAVFTGLHAFDQTASALVAVTILSLVFSGVTILRRSIIPAIVAHALFDLSQFLLLNFQAGDSWT
jgi:membrane protease YdiL (CAAX protease family)